jgi:hypothetical protein
MVLNLHYEQVKNAISFILTLKPNGSCQEKQVLFTGTGHGEALR